MDRNAFPTRTAWSKEGPYADVWLLEVRSFVGTILPGLLHRMIGAAEVLRLQLPALNITEVLTEAPENLGNETNRARAKVYSDEQALIRRVTMAVQQALPEQELANLRASVAVGEPFNLTTIYATFKIRRCIQNATQASRLKDDIAAITYRMGDDVEDIIGRIRILDAALNSAAVGIYARGEESKVHGLLNTLKTWPHRDTWIKDLRGRPFTFQTYSDMAVQIQHELPLNDGLKLNSVAPGPAGSEVKELQDKIIKLEATISRISSKSVATRTKPSNPCHKHPNGVHTWDNCSENPESANHGKSYKERQSAKK